MPVTFARLGTDYTGSATFTAPTPSGTGGIIVVVGTGKASPTTPWSPATPADWTELGSTTWQVIGGDGSQIGGAWWTIDDGTQDMGFVSGATGEGSLLSFRVSDADTSSPSVVGAIQKHLFQS
jgi:hypothetical protein